MDILGVARGLASRLRLKPANRQALLTIRKGRQRIGISTEIETFYDLDATKVVILRRQRIGISTEIETFNHHHNQEEEDNVARGLASRLRLKLVPSAPLVASR